MKIFNQIKSKRLNCNRTIFNILIQISTFSIFNYVDNIYLRIFRNSQFSIYLSISRIRFFYEFVYLSRFLTIILRIRVYLFESLREIYLRITQSEWRFVFSLRVSHRSFSNSHLIFFLIISSLHLHFFEWINNVWFSIFVRATSKKSNQSKIRLIHSSQKNTKKISCA